MSSIENEASSRKRKEPEQSDSPIALSDEDSSSDSDSSGSSSSEDESDVDITERTDVPDNLKSHVEQLRALRNRIAQSTQDNRREVYKEHQRQRENPGEQRRYERKRHEAEKLKRREDYTGNDYERSRFKEYSIEQVEKYQKKRAKAEANIERGFAGYEQMNQRKYERDVEKLKPDLAAYQKEKEMAAAGSAGEPHRPDPRKVDKLARSIEDQQKKRAGLHKPSIEKEGEDVSYINDRNARFNRKMSRAYDKYTKEIKDNFERGTAL